MYFHGFECDPIRRQNRPNNSGGTLAPKGAAVPARLSPGPPWPRGMKRIEKRETNGSKLKRNKRQLWLTQFTYYFPKRTENIKVALGVLCDLAVTWRQTMSTSRKTLKDPCRLSWSLEVHGCAVARRQRKNAHKSHKRTKSAKSCDNVSSRKTTIRATSEICPHQSKLQSIHISNAQLSHKFFRPGALVGAIILNVRSLAMPPQCSEC